MAIFTVTTTSKINLPPSQVGDGAAETDHGVTYTFTIADFTTETTPIYIDPEGDSAAQLKILSLTLTGILQYNSINITVNQIINFSDIGIGLLTFVPDNATETGYIETFTFSIADAGSGTFVS